MKKTVNIHLGGMPFIIDEDAYNLLYDYIESLKAKFTDDNERTEIIADIEARMAEVFSKRMEKRQVIDETDINYIISQLGKPEDIAGGTNESESTQQSFSSASSKNKTYTQTGEKKLYRDADNRIIGGVIGGLCQYFGYSEPLWPRIFFALLLWFSFGTFALVYIVLWLLIPKANTRAEKLQMRGEPVTLETLEKEVQDTMSRANDVFNRSVKDNDIFGKMLNIGTIFLKGFLKIAAVIVFIICLLILIGFVAATFGFSMLGLPAFAPLTRLFVDSHFVYIAAVIAGILVVGIPLFSVMYATAKFILSSKVANNKTVTITLTILWAIAVATLFAIGTYTAKNFDTKEISREQLPISQPSGGTLYIASYENSISEPFFTGSNIGINGITLSENGFILGTSEFELRPSKDDLFHVEKVLSARGKSKADARKTIGLINYRYAQTDSVILLSPDIEVFKNAKFRNQEVKSVIYIPAGKKLVFTDENLTDIELNNETFYAGELPEKVFTVKDGKVICDNCGASFSNEEVDAQVSVNGANIVVRDKGNKETIKIKADINGVTIDKYKEE